MERWRDLDPEDIMCEVFWLRGQIPPTHPEKRKKAWEEIKEQLERMFPKEGDSGEDNR